MAQNPIDQRINEINLKAFTSVVLKIFNSKVALKECANRLLSSVQQTLLYQEFQHKFLFWARK